MRGPFLVGGSLPRKPCQYLMDGKGLYKNGQTAPEVTNEKMNFSVRVLRAAGSWSCHALKKYRAVISESGEIPNKSVQWRFHRRDRTPTAITLPEEPFEAVEKKWLKRWMDEERKTKGERHAINSSSSSAHTNLIIGVDTESQTRNGVARGDAPTAEDGMPESEDAPISDAEISDKGAFEMTTNVSLSDILLLYLDEAENPTLAFSAQEEQ